MTIKFSIIYQIRDFGSGQILPLENFLVRRDGKNCAIPSLHSDPPAGGAKVPARQLAGARCLRPDASVRTGRVTQPPRIAGLLALIPDNLRDMVHNL